MQRPRGRSVLGMAEEALVVEWSGGESEGQL